MNRSRRWRRQITGVALMALALLPVPECGPLADASEIQRVKVPVGEVRSLPSQTGPLIDLLKDGDEVPIMAKEGDWMIVKLSDGRLGWVSVRIFTAPEKDAPEPTTEVDASEPVPPQNPEKMPPEQTSLERTSSGAAARKAPPAWSAEVRVRSARVRSGPTDRASVLFGIPEGEVVGVLREREDWLLVMTDDGRSGWAHRNLFSSLESAPTSVVPPPKPAGSASASTPASAPTTTMTARVRVTSGRIREAPATNAGVEFGVTQDETVTILKTDGDWYLVRAADGDTGWGHNSLFHSPVSATAEMATTAPETPSSTADEPTSGNDVFQVALKVPLGRVRKAPSLSGSVAFHLNKGDVVDVVSTDGDWYRIRTQDERLGWAHRMLFSTDVPKLVEAVLAMTDGTGEESLRFTLNGFFPPRVYADEETRTPVVVCEFPNVLLSPSLSPRLEPGGDYLRNVILSATADGGVRAEVHLAPNATYSVSQHFFKQTNTYVLTVRPAGA